MLRPVGSPATGMHSQRGVTPALSQTLPFPQPLLRGRPCPCHFHFRASSHSSSDWGFLGIGGNMDCILLRKSFIWKKKKKSNKINHQMSGEGRNARGSILLSGDTPPIMGVEQRTGWGRSELPSAHTAAVLPSVDSPAKGQTMLPLV